jgi:hypothetical protein
VVTQDAGRRAHVRDQFLRRVAIQLDGWKEIRPSVPVNRVGTFVYVMENENSGVERVRIVIHISVVAGRKRIRIRSPVIVKNKLDVSLDLRLEYPNSSRHPLIKRSLLPNTSYAVPVDSTTSSIKVRPVASFEWSTSAVTCIAVSNTRSQMAMRSTLLACRRIASSDPMAEKFRCCATVAQETYPPAGFSGPSHTIAFHAPFIIENLLPEALSFDILPGSTTDENLEPGRQRMYYEVNIEAKISLKLRIPGYKQLDTTLAYSPSDVPANRLFTVVEVETGRKLDLLAVETIHCAVSGARMISFVCPYWIINKTGLAVIIRQDEQCKASVLRRPWAEDSTPLLFSATMDYGSCQCRFSLVCILF